MSVQTNIPYPGSAWRPGVSFTPKSMVESLSNDPNSCQCQWWRALANPAFTAQTGEPASTPPTGAFFWTKTAGDWVGIAMGAHMAQKLFPQGDLEVSDIVLKYDSTVWDIGQYDYICLGIDSTNSRRFNQKESLVRNQYQDQQPGTITATGTAVVGSGTAFTAFSPGAIINVGQEARVVASIANNTHLTLVSAFGRNYTDIRYAVGRDTLLYWPACALKDIRTVATVYTPGTDATIVDDANGETRIVWSNPATCPGPGAAYSVAYSYFPRYQVTDYGIKGQVVNGYPVPDVVQAKLWKPQSVNL